MKLKKLLLFSLSLVFALSLTFGLGGAFKAAADGEAGTKLFTGAHVSLTEDIVTKFEYTAPAGYTSASYTFTYRGETTEAKTATVKEGENTIEFAEANPARIGETIIANLTLTGIDKEPVTETCNFSVADYLKTLLTAAPSTFTEIKTQEQYVAMRTLAANLVNYSAKTQEYIGLADTSSALLTTETVKNFVGSMEPNGTDANVGPLTETDKYGFLGASLLLDGRVSVCFYFVAESTENLTLEIAFDGGSKTTLTEIVAAPEIAVKEGVTAYKAVLEGIPAIDMDKKFTAKLLSGETVVGNEVTYSVKSYAYAMLSSDNAKMKSLATAIYNYGLSAKSYNEAMKVTIETPDENAALGEVLVNYNADATATTIDDWNNTDGAYIYNAVEKDGWIYKYRNYIVRFNPIEKTTVKSALSVNKFDDENVAMFTYRENIYVYDKKEEAWKSLPLLFAANATGATVESLPIELGAYTTFRNIYVFEDTGNIAVFTGSKIVLLDSNGAEKTTYAVPTNSVNRMGGSKDGFIYYTANVKGAPNPAVCVIDIKNNIMNTLLLPNVSENPANSKISSIFELNGTLCYSLFKWDGKTDSSNIQQVTFKNAFKGKLPYKELGEVIQAEGFETTLEVGNTFLPAISGTVKGVVTDGEYFYMANYAGSEKDVEGNVIHYTQILKTDKLGNVIGKSGKFANGGKESYNDTTYLLYKDGYVYAFSGQFSSIYRIETDDITANGTCAVGVTTDITFAGITKVSAMGYDEINNRYAVRSSNTLYLVDGETKTIYKTVANAIDGTQTSVVVDENYVYLMKEEVGGIAFIVYDWQGNKITQFIQTGLITQNLEKANIPSMVIEGGKVYIFAKPWEGACAGNVIIYTIDLNKLAG